MVHAAENSAPLSQVLAALLDAPALEAILRGALAEDLGPRGDITTQCLWPQPRRLKGQVAFREPGVLCGGALLPRLIAVVGGGVGYRVCATDGDALAAGSVVAQLEGDGAAIVALERTALNFIGFLSGIATATAAHVAAVAGTGAQIVDTRKTVPGMRLLSKYAVRCGGGVMHRLGLHDAMLIKDNHAAGLTSAAFAQECGAAAGRARPLGVKFVEVEADTLEQVAALLALPAGTLDILLLDNMSLAQLAEAKRLRDYTRPGVLLEASGGVTLSTVAQIAHTGIDRIAVGAITHSVRSIDIGLDVR